MLYREETRDLFSLPLSEYAERIAFADGFGKESEQGYCLAHCISADFAMGAGIAKEFVNRFNVRQETLDRYPKDVWNGHGYCLPLTPHIPVYNLVTKQRYYHKPTYETLGDALLELKERVKDDKVTKLAMPLIGCGLDRLNWYQVCNMIQQIFADTDIEILICRK